MNATKDLFARGARPDNGYAGLQTAFAYPAYYVPRASLIPGFSDKYLSLLAPIAIYWITSAWYFLLDVTELPFFEKYRIHESEEVKKRNRVSAARVFWMVVLQQVIQTILGIFVLESEETSLKQVFADHEGNVQRLAGQIAWLATTIVGPTNAYALLKAFGPWLANWVYWWGIPAFQAVLFCLVMDAWEYALHRSFHESRWLYNNFHSHHHRLYVPYAFGALYNHPFEGLLFDSAGAAVAHAASFMTIRQGILLFTFSTMKTVCDHGGYAFPPWLDPLHLIFPNTAEYHDVHHQMQGLRYNYSQPFFVHFDVVFGTRMSAEKFAKMQKVNKRYKEKTAEAGDAKSTATAMNGHQTDALSVRQRHAKMDDQKPEDIVASAYANGDSHVDPKVTLSGQAYRAKAGTAT